MVRKYYVSDIIDFSNLNMLNSRGILIYYGIKQAIHRHICQKRVKGKS